MAKWRAPASYTAGRKLTIAGTTYAAGATISNATVKAIKHVGALLSNRDIIPNVDPHYRKGKVKTPTPTDMPAVRRKAL